MKYAYIATISPGYMFAMNANMNANKYYETNADVHLLYRAMEGEYMKNCESAFPFKVKWIGMDNFSGSSFYNAKYRYAATLLDEYDSICIIDADLFICCDTKEYFEKVAKEDVLISATHVWSGMTKKDMLFENHEALVGRDQAYLADFPVFINPKFGEKLFNCWYENTSVDASKEFFHPLVAFNRCVCKTLSPEQIISLDGEVWVCDRNYWEVDYIRKGNEMINSLGKRVHAIHNKWWKNGVANNQWLACSNYIKEDDTEMIKRVDRGEKNMNEIKDFMAWFNEMTPATKRDDYLKEKIDRKKYLREKGLI